MNGTMFVKSDDGLKPVGYVDEESVRMTCAAVSESLHGLADVISGSFSCSVKMSADAICRVFEELYIAPRRKARRLRADFARRRKLGGTRRHKGGRL